MPSWNDLLHQLASHKDPKEGSKWLNTKQAEVLSAISKLRNNRNVIFYASAFLQKPQAPAFSLQISHEDINGFMSVMNGMDWSKNLTLILHTPGGITNAAETIVEYLIQKFKNIEVIIPTFAMSAGTMISLASQNIIMGRQSQLGPIDPQLPISGRFVSAKAIQSQFDKAKEEILSDVNTAPVWAPVLQSLGPALLQEARDALEYGEEMVARWLENRMFNGLPDAYDKSLKVSKYFNRSADHKSHGRRINREEAKSQGLNIEELEINQNLQDAVLTAYHLITIVFEKSPASKIICNNASKMWVKNI